MSDTRAAYIRNTTPNRLFDEKPTPHDPKGTDGEVWTDEVRAAVRAVEEKYDIATCSSDHLRTWVNRSNHLGSQLEALTASHEAQRQLLEQREATMARLRADGARMIAALKDGLDEIDAVNERCPCHKSSIGYDECPKCGATPSQNCGPNVTVLSRLERIVRAALTQEPEKVAAPSGQTPDGWVLVPREPTPEMLTDAGAMWGYCDGYQPAAMTADECHIEWWKAMIAAAPPSGNTPDGSKGVGE